jgi:hypothetical protein
MAGPANKKTVKNAMKSVESVRPNVTADRFAIPDMGMDSPSCAAGLLSAGSHYRASGGIIGEGLCRAQPAGICHANKQSAGR